MSTYPNLAPFMDPSAAPRPALQGTFVRRTGRTLLRGLLALGHARARSELLRLARIRSVSNPALARQLREAALRPLAD
ncbi:MAG: hypothetical protein ABIV63_05675 [Caldimonas sp.]